MKPKLTPREAIKEYDAVRASAVDGQHPFSSRFASLRQHVFLHVFPSMMLRLENVVGRWKEELLGHRLSDARQRFLTEAIREMEDVLLASGEVKPPEPERIRHCTCPVHECLLCKVFRGGYPVGQIVHQAPKIPDPYRVRELTFNERATWGTCLKCGAIDGQHCIRPVGRITIVTDAGGWSHTNRLDNAPLRVREVPA